MAPRTATAGWQLDTAGAENYERNLVPIMDPWAVDLVDAVGVRSGARVLDVACGTGIVARHAAARVGPDGEVSAVDVNPAMLAVADRVTASVNPPIRWREASADDLPFADATFDAVLCQQGLQFFPDRPAALRELHRVTAPAGRMGVGTCGALDHQPGYTLLVDVLARSVGVAAADVIRSPYVLGDADRLRGLVGDAGFRDVRLRRSFTTFRLPSAAALLQAETSSSPLGDLLVQLDEDVLAALLDDLERTLGAYRDDDGVVFPFETLLVTATR